MRSLKTKIQPVDLGADGVVATLGDVLAVCMAATDKQVAAHKIENEEGRAEFEMSCDALNLHRLGWRLGEELGRDAFPPDAGKELKAEICRQRKYDTDDFESAMLATRDRARLPYGWTALDLALARSLKAPIQLLHKDLAEARLPTMIASVALQLQIIQETEAILLPIDALRDLFTSRKVVISGAVIRLVEAGVLAYVNASYHTGKAREFRFVAKEGTDYAYVKSAE